MLAHDPQLRLQRRRGDIRLSGYANACYFYGEVISPRRVLPRGYPDLAAGFSALCWRRFAVRVLCRIGRRHRRRSAAFLRSDQHRMFPGAARLHDAAGASTTYKLLNLDPLPIYFVFLAVFPPVIWLLMRWSKPRWPVPYALSHRTAAGLEFAGSSGRRLVFQSVRGGNCCLCLSVVLAGWRDIGSTACCGLAW